MNGSWRVSLRLAWRQIWRAKRRSLLVVAMIGGPVLLFAAVSTLYRTAYDISETENALREIGSADALVTPQDGPLTQDPTGQLFESAEGDAAPWSTAEQVEAATGGQATAYRTGEDLVLIPTERGARAVEAREVDLRQPAAAGLATLTAGRLPRTTEEVVVSRALADRGYATGDRLSVEGRGSRTVVGVLRMNGVSPKNELVVGLPGSVLADDGARPAYLVDTGGRAVGWEKVQELNRHGLIVQSRAVLLDPPPIAPRVAEVSGGVAGIAIFVLIVVIVLLEVVLLAGPAFAVGTRRQARQLALVVATGATGRQVRRIVLTQAAALGLGSALAGVGLGVAGLALARPWLEMPLNATLYPLRVGPIDLVALVVAGTFAAVAAAGLPAAQAARQDTVAVLAGRRGEVTGRRGWPIVGLALAAIGAGLVAYGAPREAGEQLVAVGTVAVVLGAILVTPVVIRAIGRLGGRFPLPLRLASRDSARHTSRTAPVVAAIMATVAGLTAVAIASSSDAAEQRRDYRPRLTAGAMAITLWSVTPEEAGQLVDLVGRELPDSRPGVAYEAGPSAGEEIGAGRDLGVLSASCRNTGLQACLAQGGGPDIRNSAEIYGNVVAEPDVLDRWLARPLSAEQRQVLERGGVLVSNPKAIGADGTVRALTYRMEGQGEGQTLTDTREIRLPAAGLPRASGPYEYLAETAMTTATAARLGLDVEPSRIVVPPPASGIGADQEDRVRELAAGVSQSIDVYVERGYRDMSTTVFLLLGLVGALIALVATGTATALALDDARPDFATLAAIGAAPVTRRAAAASQAAITGGLGALFGVAVGVVPGLALTWPLTAPSTGGHIIDMPWLLLATAVVAVPLVAVLGAAALTRSKLAMVRRYE